MQTNTSTGAVASIHHSTQRFFPFCMTVSTGFRGTVCFIITLIISEIFLRLCKWIVKDLREHPRSRQRFPQPKLIQLLILLLCSWTAAFKTLLILTLSFYVVTIKSYSMQLLIAGSSPAFPTVSHWNIVITVVKYLRNRTKHPLTWKLVY